MKKIMVLMLCMAMIFSMSVYAFADDTSTFDGIFNAAVNAGNIQEVVYVKGSWYEMGKQYAMQQLAQLENNWTAVMSIVLKMADKETVYTQLNSIVEHFRKSDPAVYDFITGIAEGAAISEGDAAAALFGSSVLNADLLMTFNPDRDNTCMALSVWGEMTQDSHVLGAANLDAETTTPAAMFSQLVAFPDEGYAAVATGGLQGNAFLNSNGLVISYAGGPHGGPTEDDEILNRDGTYFDGIFGLWYASVKCGTAAEAVEFLTEGDWLKEGNVNIADASGDAYHIEQRAYATVVRRSGDYGETDYLLSANGFFDESWKNENYYEYEDCPARYATVEKMMNDVKGNVTPATVASALGSIKYYYEGEWSEDNWDYGYYQFFSPEGDDGYFKTIIRSVIDATERTAYTLRGHAEKFRSDVPYATCRYTAITLGENMSATNHTAEFSARDLVRNAGYILYHTNNPGEKQVEYYDMACEALHTGANYTHMADYAEASGNTEEAILLFGLATSQYLNAQRFAQEAVREDIILK